MKLLFDENLSPRLVERLADLYPERACQEVRLERAPDAAVWAYARENAFTIATKDADFGEMAVLLNAPPKVIWFRRGNCSTDEIQTIPRAGYKDIEAFHNDPQEAVLVLF